MTDIMPHPPPPTTHRHRRLPAAGLFALVLTLAPMTQLASCGGPNLRGNVYVNVWCQPDGIYFTAVTSGFVPNIPFRYDWRIYKDDVFMFHDVSLTYYTDSRGNHNGLSRQWADCGHGVYRIEMIARDLPDNNQTYFTVKEISC